MDSSDMTSTSETKEEYTAYTPISEYRLDGPCRSIKGVPKEFEKADPTMELLMKPVNFALDFAAWIVIILLGVVGILPFGIYLSIKGGILSCISPVFRRKKKRFGGFTEWLINALLTSNKPVWDLLFSLPRVGDNFNILMTCAILKRYVDMMGNMVKYDMEHDYTCQSVYDNRGKIYGRQLPRCDSDYTNRLMTSDSTRLEKHDKNNPKEQTATDILFSRNIEGSKDNPSSKWNTIHPDGYKIETNRNASLLLSHYAQWLTHQFFNTAPYSEKDPKACYKSQQPIGFNMSQLYGSTDEIRNRLRLFKGGLLRSQWVHDLEWLPIKKVEKNAYGPLGDHAKYVFDTPIELANFTPGFMAIQTLWFRHHQYCARTLARQYPEWDDERLFETAKLIVHLCVFQITVNDYVRCISNKYGISWFTPQLATDLFESWIFKIFGPAKHHTCIYSIVAEFNILYRWHQMMPPKIKIMKNLDYKKEKFSYGETGDDFDTMDYISESVGNCIGKPNIEKYENNLERILLSAHLQHSGKICLQNHPKTLVDMVVKRGMYETRFWGLRGFNDYRRYIGMEGLEFNEFTEDINIQNALKSVYETPDDIELYPGFFAGDKDDGGLHAPFLSEVGAAWTFPGLFAMEVLKEGKGILDIIKPIGVKIIQETGTLDELAHLHTNLEKGSLSFFCKSKE